MTARFWLAVVMVTVGCGGSKSGSDAPPAPKPAPKDAIHGLDLRLSSGKSGPPAVDHATLPPAAPLDATAVTQLLARAKPLVADPADQQAFAVRPASQPPPRAGQTITAAFPPATSAGPPPVPNAAAGLHVTRWMPEGAVPLAPELSVTFDQPMVAVTSQTDAAAVTPVTLSPQPKGKWRWIGTRTILFDPEVRFPQATTYTVTIPSGTKSAAGAALTAAKTFTFETPPPGLVNQYPTSGTQRLDAPMFVMFDQKVDPSAVLAKLRVTANGKPRAVRLLTEVEIAKAAQIESLVAAAKADHQDGRWLAFRAKDALPADAEIAVELPAGTPSAEGPNPTKTAQKFTFRTYPPLKVVEAACGWGTEGCRPQTPIRVEFNNSLDTDAFDPAQVTVTPSIPEMRVFAGGTSIAIAGAKVPRTSYTVTVAAKVKDEFGQALGAIDKHTFAVGDPEAAFYGPSETIVLDPAAPKRTLDFFTTAYTGLKVRLYKVTPADYPAYVVWIGDRWQADKQGPPPGTKVFDAVVPVAPSQQLLGETQVDLSTALDAQGFGHCIAIVEPTPWTDKSPNNPAPQLISWVQATNLGVDGHSDSDSLIVYASDLATGKPVAGVELTEAMSKITGTTGADGLATLALAMPAPYRDEKFFHYLIAKHGADTALLTETNGRWSSRAWEKQIRRPDVRGYTVDDRRLYRPGEEVSIAGWVRFVDPNKGGDIVLVGDTLKSLTWEATDAQYNKVGTGKVAVTPQGGFTMKMTLPKTPNLGNIQINFSSPVPEYFSVNHMIRVEEFRRPEFEVTARASDGPFLLGGAGDVTLGAKYFTGAPLPGAQVTWNVSAQATSFTPPNRDDYQFGTWHPWWGRDSDEGGFDDDVAYYGDRARARDSWTLEAKTDAVGEHVLHLDFLGMNPPVPMSVTTEATVTDVNRQTWTTSTSLVVHPAELYVGLKAHRPFVEQGKPYDLDVIGVDLDGKLVAGAKIAVTAERLTWKYEKGDYKVARVDPQACALTAATTPGQCHFATDKGGEYHVTAVITDAKGRTSTSELGYTVAGGEEGPPSREVAMQTAKMLPDKKEYAPGNTAEILIAAPFYPAEGLLTWRRSGIVKVERITIDGPTKVVTVPIEDAMTPNLVVRVDLAGQAVRTNDKGIPDPALPKRVAFAVGSIELSIPPHQRTLSVVVTPAAAKVAPAQTTSVGVEVRDAAGAPVTGADVQVIVVDESVLALTNATFESPIDTFYKKRGNYTHDVSSRAQVKLAQPPKSATASLDDPPPPEEEADGDESGGTGTAMALEEGKMGKKDSDRAEGQYKMKKESADPNTARTQAIAQARNAGILGSTALKTNGAFASLNGTGQVDATPIAVRQNFNALAAFAMVKTDAAGKATADIAMPDNLTRYRVIAIAASGAKQFGKGESAITARLPLMVRPSPPRFLNFGDTFQLPVTVQNQTDAPMTVSVAVVTTNLALTAGAGRSVVVPANDRVEVRFPAAAEMAGTARIEIVGAAGDVSDAANLEIPVWTPATSEAFATYGTIDDGVVAQPVALPGKVIPQFGGLEITASSTNVAALTDSFLYIVHYPFDCAEQRASRILSIASLRDVLEAFKVPDLPTRAELEASMAADFDHLVKQQNDDGGFAYWERNRPSDPFLTVHVANAFARAKQKGYAVPPVLIEHTVNFLKDIESHYDVLWPPDIRRATSAYALYVRKLLGDTDTGKAQKLLADAGGPEKLPLEADGWLLATFAQNPAAADQRKAILRHVMNKVSETAGAANFTTSYGDGAYLLLASDKRVDAVMLEALILEQPDLDLIPKIVTGLLANRSDGHWLNTQVNSFALVALELYFRTYEKVTPNFVARMWLGADYAGDLAFRGRSTKSFQVDVAMKDVVTHDKQALTIQKDGPGRLYYRIGMRYAPASFDLAAADYGFVVERTYEPIDDPKDVVRAADGVWHIKAGARVRVRIKLVNENRRYHVALVDPLPAGLEILNPELAGTAPVKPRADDKDKDRDESSDRYWWWYGPWYSHQNLRDERAEAFTEELYEGVHPYDYVARATTPGTFVVPPPKAEEMYMPETFGRGASDRVIVE